MKKDMEQNNLNSEQKEALERFREMIMCPTVSFRDEELTDFGKFEEFKGLLKENYPLISSCETFEVHKTGIVFRIPGKTSAKSCVLMAHYDVVPVNEEEWKYPPFSAHNDGTHIWGRGTLDTKCTLFAAVESVESLLDSGDKPAIDIYLCFSGSEEISGEDAPKIAEKLGEMGVSPSFVLDEGGAVVEGVFPGLDRPAALIGVGEKGYMDVKISIREEGGHSSTPPLRSGLGKLSEAVVRLEKNQMSPRFTYPVENMIKTLGAHSKGVYKFLFKNMKTFGPILLKFFSSGGGELNAMVRTTTAVTRMSGSDAFNVLPSNPWAGINFRLLEGDDEKSVLSHIKKVAGEEFRTEVVGISLPSPISKIGTPEWELMVSACEAVWPEAVVSPYLMLGGSDARHYSKICDRVFRFAPLPMTSEELALIHSPNERIKISGLMGMVGFYKKLLELLPAIV